MARDDEDETGSEESKGRKDRDDEDRMAEGEPPSKKRSRDEDDDDDRPRKKDDDRKKDLDRGEPKPINPRVLGAVFASLLWGGFILFHNCGLSSTAVIGLYHLEKKNAEGAIGMIFNPAFHGGGAFGEPHKGFAYTSAGAQFVMMILGAVTVGGGVTLLMRMGFGKFLAIGGPAAMVLVEMLIFGICLAITSGRFLTAYNVDFFITIVFSLVIAGANAFLLLNRDVAKSLK